MTNGDFIVEDGVLTKYIGDGGDVVIPAGVVEIGPRAFEKCTEVTSVRIHGDVRKIEYLAFNGCAGLTAIDVPEGVEVIGDSAFCGCVHLQTVKLPASLTLFVIFGEVFSAFEGCTRIRSIVVDEANPCFSSCNANVIFDKKSGTLLFGCGVSTIPEGTKRIGSRAFYKQNNLLSVILPQGLKTIEREAFFGCEGLQEVFFPASVKEVAPTAFGCCSLRSITVDGANETYKGEGNTLVEKESGTVILGSERSVLPDGVKVIGEFAFLGVVIKKITIPSSVLFIEACAFCQSALEEIVLPEGVLEIKTFAFADCPNLKRVVLPHSLLDNVDFDMDYGVADNAFSRSPIEEIVFNGTPEERRLLLEGTGIE